MFCCPAIGNIAPGQEEAEWPALAVRDRMKLAVASVPADPDGILHLPGHRVTSGKFQFRMVQTHGGRSLGQPLLFILRLAMNRAKKGVLPDVSKGKERLAETGKRTGLLVF